MVELGFVPNPFGRALRGARPLWLAAAAARCMSGIEEPTLILRAEQAPNPDSRVTLTSDRDSTGMPRIALDWRMGAQDVASAAALVAGMAIGSIVLWFGIPLFWVVVVAWTMSPPAMAPMRVVPPVVTVAQPRAPLAGEEVVASASGGD